jgi:DNA-binding response OmpR family regulator
MHLLLIEDDLDLGRALLQGLKAEGFTTEWLRRAADAPPRLHGGSCDCVLLELSLPDGTGFDLLTRGRAAGDTLPVLIITARSALEERLAGLDNGAGDFIVKPFATPELASRVRAVARRYALQHTPDVHAFLAVLHNVLDDAIRYSRDGGRLAVELAREPGRLLLTVADDGPGIAAADRQRVFERFHRGAGHVVQGTGLGLAIVRQAARRLGGTVALAAGLDGRGACFTLALPASDRAGRARAAA